MTIGKKIALGYAAPLAILLVIAGMACWTTYQLLEAAESVTHSHLVTHGHGRAAVHPLKDAETGQRGYLLTGEDNDLQPYDDAKAGWEKSYNDLKGLIRSAEQKQRVENLKPLVEKKFMELQKTIDLAARATRRRDKDEALVVVRSGEGKQVMDQIRANLDEGY